MRIQNLFNNVQPFISTIAVVAIAGVLVFTIYFTRFDVHWVAFLAGVLVAAVLAEATRLSRVEWLLMRRSAQMATLKDKLEREVWLRKSAEEAAAAGKPRLRLIDEVLPTMVVFVDAEGHCRYHNRAFRDWLHLRPEQVDGRHMSVILGAKVYQEIASYVRQSMDGHAVKYERTHKMPNNAAFKLAVKHLPQFADDGKVSGFFMLTDDVSVPGDVNMAEHEHDVAAHQELFVHSFSEQFGGQEDAKTQIVAAIEKNEFHLFCQQIVPLVTQSDGAEYHEILVRLMEEEEGMIPPGAFFPLAEKHGLMSRLDRWVVQHVAEQIASRIQQQTWQEGSVFFVNVAESTIVDRSFSDYLEVTLLEYGVPGATLCFEVPDAELARRAAQVAEFAQRLQHLGCRIALSGFGRDKVSFDLIRGFRVDYLKIDGAVILNILRDPVSLAKVVAINKVARKVGVKTVAEMVENDEIIIKLREIGVDFAQGFGISMPRAL
ncbi:MAG TPA: EAL domain-containing protein [Gallionellaceae bacterium]|nr:EAL domain-containing protein [Gallionellaceae bacterium]